MIHDDFSKLSYYFHTDRQNPARPSTLLSTSTMYSELLGSYGLPPLSLKIKSELSCLLLFLRIQLLTIVHQNW